MAEWTLEVYDDHIIIRGMINMHDLNKVLNSFCGHDWIAAPDKALEHQCTFFFCSKNKYAQLAYHAAN